jgi:hypothetical protein
LLSFFLSFYPLSFLFFKDALQLQSVDCLDEKEQMENISLRFFWSNGGTESEFICRTERKMKTSGISGVSAETQ